MEATAERVKFRRGVSTASIETSRPSGMKPFTHHNNKTSSTNIRQALLLLADVHVSIIILDVSQLLPMYPYNFNIPVTLKTSNI